MAGVCGKCIYSLDVGHVIAVVLGLIGLFTGGMLVLVAVFVFLAAQAEMTMVRGQTMVGGLRPYSGQSGQPGAQPDNVPVGEAGIVWVPEVRMYRVGDRVVRTVGWRPLCD